MGYILTLVKLAKICIICIDFNHKFIILKKKEVVLYCSCILATLFKNLSFIIPKYGPVLDVAKVLYYTHGQLVPSLFMVREG